MKTNPILDGAMNTSVVVFKLSGAATEVFPREAPPVGNREQRRNAKKAGAKKYKLAVKAAQRIQSALHAAHE